ncbi:MBL fold metallo-hydrolase [Patescibacteria group bacterium]|nr:MBL fold metallo-hydrolase [Patescibacteria group bacterium]
MQIIWHGQSCFQIIASFGKGNRVNIIVDPFSEDIGLKLPSLEADILLVSHYHHDHDNVKAVKGSPFLITGPGEYEIKNVFIQGIPAFHDDSKGRKRGEVTIFTIETEGMRLCHLGDIGQRELNPDQLEKIGQIDILMIPVGGIYTISSKEASKIISQIEPKIVIPMHYQVPRLNIKLESLDKFLKTMGQKSIEPLVKLFVKEKNLPTEEMKIVILKP